MKKSYFYALIILMWAVLLLNVLFGYDAMIDADYGDNLRCEDRDTQMQGITPFSCTQDAVIAAFLSNVFWGILGTVILSKLITIDDDEEE